jgi:hypothetical protein
VRIESGSGLVEVTGINKGSRITVTSGSLKTVIDSRGVYRFTKDAAAVLSGKLKTWDSRGMDTGSGWQITNTNGAYERAKVTTNTASEIKRFMSAPGSGFVNAVEGEANVHLHERVQTGKPVKTGPGGHVELLLAPGSFLRLDENSAVIVESDFLKDTVLRIVSGTALLESDIVDPELRTRVVVGLRKARIGATGLFRLTSDTASVIDGALQLELEVGNLEHRIGKGRQIAVSTNGYQESDHSTKEDRDELDDWSARRSYEVATANFMAQYGDSHPNFFTFQSRLPNAAAWIFSPPLNGFTFIPLRTYESYYKQTFMPLRVLLPPPALLPPPNPCEFGSCIPPPGLREQMPNPATSPNVPAPAAPANPTAAPAPAPAPAPPPPPAPPGAAGL